MNTTQFDERYKKLNLAQKRAVDTIDGPVLVVAGPGSGKTEILSLRVANILLKTDTAASNILCLTFTESASVNMRERLVGLIGRDAYRVAIHTFHSFGVEVINRHREFFYGGASLLPADELVQREILDDIFKILPHTSPMQSVRPDGAYTYLYDAKRAIEQLKKAGVTPEEFIKILDHNEKSLVYINAQLEEGLSERLSKKEFTKIEKIVGNLNSIKLDPFPLKHIQSLISSVVLSLRNALNEAIALDKTEPLSLWKKDFTTKDDNGKRILKDGRYMEKMRDLAFIYTEYKKRLSDRGYYDFDDMLLDTIKAIEENEILRYELQEQYQYVLVDEFQDTNDAQMRLINLITDAVVNEGRPNIMAVGDDDQAVFKFQGAEISNILGFRSMYRDPEIVTLTQNYRSSQDILDIARYVIKKGSDRLENIIPDIQKDLIASNKGIKGGNIYNKSFLTSAHEYYWIANEIKKRIDSGESPQSIAVISREHKNLQELVPYLYRVGAPISYERQRNVFREPHIRQIIQIARFAVSISEKKNDEADDLLPEILSYPFWEIERNTIWKISVEASKDRVFWIEKMLNSDNDKVKFVAGFLLELGKIAKFETLERVLDIIIGSHVSVSPESEDDDLSSSDLVKNDDIVSPFRSYYWNKEQFKNNKAEYLVFLSGLRVFVQALREYKQGQVLKLCDLVEFVNMREKNNIPLTDSSPFTNAKSAVNLLTSHKAKGQEFETVFVISCQDDVWAGRGKSSLLPFPHNMPIAPAGDTIDDQLRLFFVAITRAKRNLYFTSYQIDNAGKEVSRLQFLASKENEEELWNKVSSILNKTESSEVENFDVNDVLEVTWENYNRRPYVNDEKALLQTLVDGYQMSVTHLDNYLNVASGGPQLFLEQNLLRFPQAKTPSGSFGTAMHSTLERIYISIKRGDPLPSPKTVNTWFEQELIKERLRNSDFELYKNKGIDSLSQFYKEKKTDFNTEDIIEFNFKNQGVVVGEAHLAGKIDKIRKEKDGMVVFDWKTGNSFDAWEGGDQYQKIKKNKYMRQLIFYKLLIENSRDFGGKFHVNKGVLEFLEPENGHCVELPLVITEEMTERLSKLSNIVYKKIINLDFPDTSKYSKDINGILQFEEDLLKGEI